MPTEKILQSKGEIKTCPQNYSEENSLVVDTKRKSSRRRKILLEINTEKSKSAKKTKEWKNMLFQQYPKEVLCSYANVK